MHSALLFYRIGEGKRCSGVFRRKETGALQFSGEGNWCHTVFRRSKQVLYCFQGEVNWCSTVLRRRKLVHSALLFTG